ncbi:MAG: hypothetical protein ACRDHO_11810 [Actinomycetota bacterium]
MRRFLVLKLPRTGSLMFGGVLDAHPSIECVNEYLNRHLKARRRGKVRALRSFYYRDPTDRDSGRADTVVGQTMNPFRYKLGASDIASAFGPSTLGLTGRRFTARHRDLPIHLVVLLRENLLKQGISLYLARQRKFESSRELIDEPSVLEGRVIDVAELARLVTGLSSKSERLRQLAARLRAETMHVTFEQLQNNPSGTFESVFEYLGVPPAEAGFDYTAGFTKMLSDDLRDVVANFPELERHPLLAGYL